MTKPHFLILTIPLLLLTTSCATIKSAARPAPSVETIQNELGCGHNVEDTTKKQKKAFSIPDRLCYDSRIPVDSDEDIDPQDGLVTPNLYSREDLNYQDLPAEVREIIELMFGETFRNSEFQLLVTPNGSATNAARIVKVYRFSAIDSVSKLSFTYDFYRQGGSLKLEGGTLHISKLAISSKNH